VLTYRNRKLERKDDKQETFFESYGFVRGDTGWAAPLTLVGFWGSVVLLGEGN
jgi:hypothetical protein